MAIQFLMKMTIKKYILETWIRYILDSKRFSGGL